MQSRRGGARGAEERSSPGQDAENDEGILPTLIVSTRDVVIVLVAFGAIAVAVVAIVWRYPTAEEASQVLGAVLPTIGTISAGAFGIAVGTAAGAAAGSAGKRAAEKETASTKKAVRTILPGLQAARDKVATLSRSIERRPGSTPGRSFAFGPERGPGIAGGADESSTPAIDDLVAAQDELARIEGALNQIAM